MSGGNNDCCSGICARKGSPIRCSSAPQQAQFTRSVLLDQFRPRGFRPDRFVACCVEWVRGSG
jgi:hypothetical protein